MKREPIDDISMADRAEEAFVNEDRTQFARVDTTELEWTPSPAAGVWRKRCYLAGDKEKGAVTSVVRYDAGSSFPVHEHPEGEELFVLEGVFTDQTGEYPAGTYILNPPGSSHAPASEPGCRLFVRLRQYEGVDPVRVDTTDADEWLPHADYEGVEVLPLWCDEEVEYRMVRLGAGTELPRVEIPNGEEIFVVSGSFQDEHGTHGPETWVRYPPHSKHTPRSTAGCELLVRVETS
jgi:anti-sigma factor ChrR (cupin superfamily)